MRLLFPLLTRPRARAARAASVGLASSTPRAVNERSLGEASLTSLSHTKTREKERERERERARNLKEQKDKNEL